jgi:hypothetical protein
MLFLRVKATSEHLLSNGNSLDGATSGEEALEIEISAFGQPASIQSRSITDRFNDAVDVLPPAKCNFGASTFD